MKNAFTEFTPQRDLFYEYILHLGLFRVKIWETSEGLYALLSDIYGNVPLKAFSQVPRPEPGDYVQVRLSKADLFNDAITNGFFNSLKPV